jgi:hypothetical protein
MVHGVQDPDSNIELYYNRDIARLYYQSYIKNIACVVQRGVQTQIYTHQTDGCIQDAVFLQQHSLLLLRHSASSRDLCLKCSQ